MKHLMILAAALLSVCAPAADGVWINNDNSGGVNLLWSEAANWQDGTPPSQGAGAFFDFSKNALADTSKAFLLGIDEDVTVTNFTMTIDTCSAQPMTKIYGGSLRFAEVENGAASLLLLGKCNKQSWIYASVEAAGDLAVESLQGLFAYNRFSVAGTLFVDRNVLIIQPDAEYMSAEEKAAYRVPDDWFHADRVVVRSIRESNQRKGELRFSGNVSATAWHPYVEEVEMGNGIYGNSTPYLYTPSILGAGRSKGTLSVTVNRLIATSSEFTLCNYNPTIAFVISNTVDCLSVMRLWGNGNASNCPDVTLPGGAENPLHGLNVQVNSTVRVPSGETKAVGELRGGAFTLTKADSGVMSLPSEMSAALTLSVADGGVAFRADPTAEDVIAGACLHLDASAAGSVLTNAGGQVLGWVDLSGSGNSMTNAYPQYDRGPLYVADGQNSLPVLDFGQLESGTGNGRHLTFDADRHEAAMMTNQCTVVAVVRLNSAGAPIFGRVGNYRREINNGTDYFNRSPSGSGIWQAGYSSAVLMGGSHWLDGQSVLHSSDLGTGSFRVLVTRATDRVAFSTLGYYGAGNRNGGIALGEVITFDRYLADAEIRVLNTHLMKKWLNADNPNAVGGAGTVSLAANTTLGLDIAGTFRPQALSAAGALTVKINGFIGRAGEYRVLDCENLSGLTNVSFEFDPRLVERFGGGSARVDSEGIVVNLQRKGFVLLFR